MPLRYSLSYLFSASLRLCVSSSLRLCISAFHILLLLNCQQKEETPTIPTLGFYHWQTQLHINEQEQAYLDDLPLKKLYIKFFDVDWDFQKQAAQSHASLAVNATVPTTIELIPTIFITNRTFQHIQQPALEELIQQIKAKLERQFEQFPKHVIQTIQIDCDWSLATKEKYFYFLEKLQQSWGTENRTLSTTIRLHQVKYAKKTGVPPVNKGLLMFYNMGEVKQYDTNNSILDLAIAKKYTDHLADYPLPLDVALPLFQWGVVFREAELIQLINQLTIKDLQDTTRFQLLDAIRWQVLKSTYLKGLYVYKGDVIRLESVPYEKLEEVTQLLQPYFKGKEFDFVFYHFEEAVIRHYSTLEIRRLMGEML